jgi:hypothetical protein
VCLFGAIIMGGSAWFFIAVPVALASGAIGLLMYPALESSLQSARRDED